MVDYAKALKEGFTAAETLTCSNQEIDEVFSEAFNQVKEASNNKIVLRVNQVIGQDKAIPVRYWSIVASHISKESKEYDLAKIFPYKEGYPITISFGHDSYVCLDKHELEIAIVDLLKCPLTGGILLSLMKGDQQNG